MRKMSYLFIIIAAVLWGTAGFFVTLMRNLGFEVMEIIFFRSFVTCVLMLIYILIKNKKLLYFKLKDLWIVVGTGIISFVFFNFCYFNAMQLTTLSVAAVLLYTAPIFVMIMSVLLFKEKFTLKKGIAIVCTFAGCCFVSGITKGGLSFSTAGLLFGIGSGLGYALYSIFGRYGILRNYSSETITFYTFLFATIASVFFTNPAETLSLAFSSVEITALCITVGIITSLAPYICYTKGLMHVESGTASVIATIEPVVAAIVSTAVFSEPMTIPKIIGIALILSSVVLLKE